MVFCRILYLVYAFLRSLECMLIFFSYLCNKHRTHAKKLREKGHFIFKLVTEKVFLVKTYTTPTSEFLSVNNNRNGEKEKLNVILMNHISTVDFIILLDYLYDQNITNFHFVLKKEIKYIPGIGQLMAFGENIIVERNWQYDQKTITRELDKIPNGGVLILFPEGTRMSCQKLEQAQKYCFQNNLPIMDNMLVPKFHGAWSILNYLKAQYRLGNVYDFTVHADNFQDRDKKDMFLPDILMSGIGPVGFHIRKLDPKEIKTDYEEFKMWLLEKWREKDKIMTSNFF